MSIAAKLIKNTAYHAAGRVWQIAVSLFLTPLILSYLGDKVFAVWALFWTLSTYFMFMDFGLSVSLVRVVSRSYAKGQSLIINRALSSLLFFYLLLGVAAFAFSWWVSPWVIGRMDVSSEMIPLVSDMLRWGIPIFALIGIVNVLAALLRGLQRFDRITAVMVASSVPNIAGTYLVLRYGFGIPGLLWVVAGVYLFQASLMLFLSGRLVPELRIGFRFVKWQVLKEMAPFGIRLQVSQLADLASYQTDKILLALLLPVSFVTMYDLGAKVASLLRDLPYSLTAAVFPAASEMHGQASFDRLWQMYDRGSKYLLILTLPMLFGLWLTAHLVIGIWLGHVATSVYQSVLILSLAYWVVISLAMSFNVGTGMGWSRPIMDSSLLQAFLNVVLSYSLIHALGFVGALYGTAMAIFVSHGLLYFRFCKHFERPFAVEFGRLWLVVKANLPAVLVCGAFVWWGNRWLQWGDRLPSFWLFMGAVVLYTTAYVASLRVFGVLDGEDLRLLGGRLPMVRWLVASPQDGGGASV